MSNCCSVNSQRRRAVTDRVSKDVRSRIMASVRSKKTAPEQVVARALRAHGFSVHQNSAELPGRPDVVVPSKKLVVFVHGCFWHGHKGCAAAELPQLKEHTGERSSHVTKRGISAWRGCCVESTGTYSQSGSARSKMNGDGFHVFSSD